MTDEGGLRDDNVAIEIATVANIAVKLADQQRQLREIRERLDAMSAGIGESLAATHAAIAEQQQGLREAGARLAAIAADVSASLGTYGQRIETLKTQLRRVEESSAHRFVELRGEWQTIRHEHRLRQGALGTLREILHINTYIGADGGPKPGTKLPLAARLYFGVRRAARPHLQRRRTQSPIAAAPINPANPVDEPPTAAAAARSAPLSRTVTMLVPDDRIDRRVLAQARSLTRHGWQTTVIAAPYPEPVDADQLAYPEVRITRIDTGAPARPLASPVQTRLPASGKWKQAYLFHDHFLAAALDMPAAVVTAHDLPVLPAAIAAADHHGGRVAYDAHELYPEQHHFGRDRIALYNEMESEIIGLAHAITTVNESIADEMAQRYHIAKPRVLLNTPEIDPTRLPLPRGNIIRKRLGLPDQRRILLFQGSLSINRNLENLTRAMAQVEDLNVALVFLGPGAEKRVELSGIATELNLLDTRVFFLDPVDQTVLLDYTASADVGIVPYPPIDLNSRLCTPNKLFEYIVAGLPILANDLPELRKFVHDNGFGQVHPMNSPTDIAQAIDGMFAADLPSYRQKLQARCGEFTWDRQARTLIDLYAELEIGAAQPAIGG